MCVCVFFFFSLFFFAFFFFFRFSPILLGQGQATAIYWENGEFHSDPVCTDPVQNFPSPKQFGEDFGAFFRKNISRARKP